MTRTHVSRWGKKRVHSVKSDAEAKKKALSARENELYGEKLGLHLNSQAYSYAFPSSTLQAVLRTRFGRKNKRVASREMYKQILQTWMAVYMNDRYRT